MFAKTSKDQAMVVAKTPAGAIADGLASPRAMKDIESECAGPRWAGDDPHDMRVPSMTSFVGMTK